MSCGISIVTKQCEQRRYYGYGVVTDKRVFSCELDSCVLEFEEKGRSGVIVVMTVVF
jgi:hypothetical protein